MTLWGVEPNPVAPLHLVSKRKTLGEEKTLPCGELMENGFGIPIGETDHLQIEKDLTVDSRDEGGSTLVFDFKGPKESTALTPGMEARDFETSVGSRAE